MEPANFGFEKEIKTQINNYAVWFDKCLGDFGSSKDRVVHVDGLVRILKLVGHGFQKLDQPLISFGCVTICMKDDIDLLRIGQ